MFVNHYQNHHDVTVYYSKRGLPPRVTTESFLHAKKHASPVWHVLTSPLFLCFFFFLLIYSPLKSQDTQFSQFYAAPLHLAPSLPAPQAAAGLY